RFLRFCNFGLWQASRKTPRFRAWGPAAQRAASSAYSEMSPFKSSRRETGDDKSGAKDPGRKDHRGIDKIQELKHFDTFYGQAPPGLIQEEKENPEDCIPDRPENKSAREFLSKAPTKGLWMPLGKEVKVMKCWRCKAYGHRTGDKECPMFLSGNSASEQFRFVHEDPMHEFLKESKDEKQERIRQLQALLEESTDSDSSTSSSSSNSQTETKKRRHKHTHSKHKSKKKQKRHHKSKKKQKKK
ncbi:unnamed protein product, partial [Ixodes hexagonus]